VARKREPSLVRHSSYAFAYRRRAKAKQPEPSSTYGLLAGCPQTDARRFCRTKISASRLRSRSRVGCRSAAARYRCRCRRARAVPLAGRASLRTNSRECRRASARRWRGARCTACRSRRSSRAPPRARQTRARIELDAAGLCTGACDQRMELGADRFGVAAQLGGQSTEKRHRELVHPSGVTRPTTPCRRRTSR
jgi:hypothetical protein